MDAPLKIAVPAQDGSDHEVVLIYRVSNRLRQWAAITNTRCTTKAHQVEAQCLQVWQQIGVIQVVDNGSRARSKAGFHGGFHREAAFDGMFDAAIAMSIPTSSSQLPVNLFFLGNRVGVGLPPFRAQADQGIFGYIV